MKKTTTTRGRRVTLYLRDTDTAKMRELQAFITGEGERANDSLMVRAALHAATTGKAFLSAYREVASVDLRFTKE